MATVEKSSAKADLEEVCRLLEEGKPVTDPELIGRVRETRENGTSLILTL
jgi:hypothetical protein